MGERWVEVARLPGQGSGHVLSRGLLWRQGSGTSLLPSCQCPLGSPHRQGRPRGWAASPAQPGTACTGGTARHSRAASAVQVAQPGTARTGITARREQGREPPSAGTGPGRAGGVNRIETAGESGNASKSLSGQKEL